MSKKRRKFNFELVPTAGRYLGKAALKVTVMGCHLDPAVMYCYAGNVELVLAGLEYVFIKGCGQGGTRLQ